MTSKLKSSSAQKTKVLQYKPGHIELESKWHPRPNRASDLRDIQKAAEGGDADCILALEMNAYRIKKYIGSYAAAMNGLDAIIFTAGIGENSSFLRAKVCEQMDYLGIDIDLELNTQKLENLLDISSKNAKVKTLVIATNEELEIASQAYQLLS